MARNFDSGDRIGMAALFGGDEMTEKKSRFSSGIVSLGECFDFHWTAGDLTGEIFGVVEYKSTGHQITDMVSYGTSNLDAATRMAKKRISKVMK